MGSSCRMFREEPLARPLSLKIAGPFSASSYMAETPQGIRRHTPGAINTLPRSVRGGAGAADQ